MNAVEFSRQAERDLEEIGDFIARDNPLAADRVVGALHTKCLLIAQRPLLYSVREDIAPGFRRALARPYGIWFQVLASKTVRIERVVHGARDLSALF